MNRVILDNVNPLNDVRLDCDKQAIFPILTSLGVDLGCLLLNSFAKYEIFDNQALRIVQIETNTIKDLGFEYEYADENCDALEYIKDKLIVGQPLVITCDCFGLPMFESTHKIAHAEHAICIYGFDDQTQEFHIIDHEYHNSFLYLKQRLRYDDLLFSYNEHKNTFGYNSILSINKTGKSIVDDYSKYHAMNFLLHEKTICDSFEDIQVFTNNLNNAIGNNKLEGIEFSRVVYELGSVMNRKVYEASVIKGYLKNNKLLELAEMKVTNISYIVAVIARYIYSGEFILSSFEKALEQLKLFYLNEKAMHEKYQNLMLSMGGD